MSTRCGICSGRTCGLNLVASTCCSHVFHRTCAEAWLLAHGVCFECQSPASSVQLKTLLLDDDSSSSSSGSIEWLSDDEDFSDDVAWQVAHDIVPQALNSLEVEPDQATNDVQVHPKRLLSDILEQPGEDVAEDDHRIVPEQHVDGALNAIASSSRPLPQVVLTGSSINRPSSASSIQSSRSLQRAGIIALLEPAEQALKAWKEVAVGKLCSSYETAGNKLSEVQRDVAIAILCGSLASIGGSATVAGDLALIPAVGPPSAAVYSGIALGCAGSLVTAGAKLAEQILGKKFLEEVRADEIAANQAEILLDAARRWLVEEYKKAEQVLHLSNLTISYGINDKSDNSQIASAVRLGVKVADATAAGLLKDLPAGAKLVKAAIREPGQEALKALTRFGGLAACGIGAAFDIYFLVDSIRVWKALKRNKGLPPHVVKLREQVNLIKEKVALVESEFEAVRSFIVELDSHRHELSGSENSAEGMSATGESEADQIVQGSTAGLENTIYGVSSRMDF